jgi:hypothetical protein
MEYKNAFLCTSKILIKKMETLAGSMNNSMFFFPTGIGIESLILATPSKK